jgi:hypothetical protein
MLSAWFNVDVGIGSGLFCQRFENSASLQIECEQGGGGDIIKTGAPSDLQKWEGNSGCFRAHHFGPFPKFSIRTANIT